MASNSEHMTHRSKANGTTDLALSRILELAKNGDSMAFAQLYQLYKRPVLALCVRMTKNYVESEDLMQDIFLQVYRKIGSFRGEAVFGTWLYTVARNVVLMHIRKRSIETVSGDVSELEDYSRAPWFPHYSKLPFEPLKRLALKRAISGLSPHRRAVLILHDVEGLSHREVGARLGIEMGTSKSQLHHAHVALRDEAWRRSATAEYSSSSYSAS